MSRPSNLTCAGAARHEPHDRAQRRGLAGAVAADDADRLAGRNRQRHALQDVAAPVPGVEVAHLEHRPRPTARDRRAAPPRASGCRRGRPRRGAVRDASTRMRSEMPMTSFMRCSTRITVRSWLSLRIRSIMARASSGLMPAVGSSRRRSRGSQASATAISRLRWSPWARFSTASWRRAARPTGREELLGARDEVAVVLALRPDVETGLHGLRRDAHVLEHAELREQVRDLERLGDAEMGEAVLRLGR